MKYGCIEGREWLTVVSGYGVHAHTPIQRIQPSLVHHVDVDTDVTGPVLSVKYK